MIHIIQKKKNQTIQMSNNWQLDKQNVVEPYNGILTSNKKGYWYILYNKDESWKHHAKKLDAED